MLDKDKQPILGTWRDRTINDLLGGLVLDGDSELLGDNELLTAQNGVLRNRVLTSDTGYIQFLNAVRGNPRRSFTYKTSASVEHVILITDLTVYRKSNEQWQYVSNGTQTTLNANEAQGSTAMDVASTTGFANGDFVGVMLDNGQMHMTTVNGAPGAGVITITDALPSAAASGLAVVKAVTLAGLAHEQVTGVVLPWNGWLVFTNGADHVKRYDPTAVTVVDLPGLTNTVCKTLALFDSSLLLGNTTESNVRFPFRTKYSAKGDATTWVGLEAGTTDLLETQSDIRQLLKLGPYLIAYRDDSIVRIAISGSGVRRFDIVTTVPDAGVFSSLAAVGMTDKHLVWGRENFFWYTGGFSIQELLNPLKESIFGIQGKLTAVERKSECFALLLKPVNEVLFIYGISAATQPQAERYHIDYQKFTRRSFGIRVSGAGAHLSTNIPGWDDLSGSWDAQAGGWVNLENLGEGYGIILGSADNDSTYLYNFTALADDAAAITTVFETKDFAHPTYLMTQDYLEIGYQAGDNVTVEISIDKGVTWLPFGTLTATALTLRTRLFQQRTSRTFRYRFTCASRLSLRYLNIRYMYVSEW